MGLKRREFLKSGAGAAAAWLALLGRKVPTLPLCLAHAQRFERERRTQKSYPGSLPFY